MLKACWGLPRKKRERIQMTDRMIDNRVKKLRELERQVKELEQEIDSIKEELKKDMEEKGIEEAETKNYIIRWKEVINKRFDTKAFEREHGNMYNQYLKQTTTRRFTIA